MNYKETISYINDIPKFTTKNKLEHTKRLLGWLGHPEESFKVVHVAGSNGKGSVCSYIDSVLRKAGKKVGLFTSPHLVTTRERFMIDGEMISEEELIENFEDVMSQVNAHADPHPTYFELLFLMAMVRFAKAGVEYAVLETGLGGRLDATNSIDHPEICIITSISLEHTQYLGNTVSEIAAEKGGIIKPGIDVICDGSDTEAAEVLSRIASVQGSDITIVRPENIKILETNGKSIDFSYTSKYYNLDLCIGSSAIYQTMNASLAALACHGILGSGADETVRSGIELARWPGRMEEVLPQVYLDGAHNPSGIAAFIDSARAISAGCEHRPLLLFSVVADKDYDSMIKQLTADGMWDGVILCGLDNSRGLEVEKIKQEFGKYGCNAVMSYHGAAEAFARGLEMKKQGQLIFCAGSLYFVGEIKEIVNDRF